MAGYQVFPAGVAARADIQGFLMNQTVMRFPTRAARDAALSGQLEDGMVCFLEETSGYYWYDSTLLLPASNDGGWRPISTPWTEYTPVWQGLSPADSSVDAAYRWEWGAIRQRGQIVIGSGAALLTTVFQDIALSRTGDAYGGVGAGVYNDLGDNVGVASLTTHLVPNGVRFSFSTAAGLITAGNPHAWRAGHVITWNHLSHPTIAGDA